MKDAIQPPLAGYTVGGGTFVFGWWSNLVTLAEQVGMVVGAIFTCCLFSHWLFKRWQEWRGV